MDQLEEEFAFLAALHDTEEAVERARDALLAQSRFSSSKDARVLKLRLLLVQQKLGRLPPTGAASAAAQQLLWEQQDELLAQLSLHSHHELRVRADLLLAAHFPRKREELFANMTSSGGLPLVAVAASASPSVLVSHCPQQHLLAPFTTPTPKFTCDVCSTRVPQAVPMYGCRECDYDVCQSCFGGNALQRTAERPTLRFPHIAREVLCNVSLARETVFSRLTPHALGVLFSLTAAGLFNPAVLLTGQEEDEEDVALSQQCAEVFAPSQLSGRLNLRALCEAMPRGGDEAALVALSRFADDECILRLVLSDLRSGQTDEDVNAGLSSNVHSFAHDSAFLRHLSVQQLLRLGAMDSTVSQQEWFAAALVERALPGHDEADDAGDFASSAPLDVQLRVLAKLRQAVSAVKTATSSSTTATLLLLDYVLLHHQVRLDRQRRQPLLPHSLTLQQQQSQQSQTNLALLLEYLSCAHRPAPLMAPPASRQVLCSAASSDALCQLVSGYFPAPSPQQDAQLVEREMADLFVWKHADPSSSFPMLAARFVRDVYDRAMTPPATSTSAPTISFCDYNPARFPAQASQHPVELTCDFTNLHTAQCKVYEVDWVALLRHTQRDVSANINLDGLVPHRDFSVQLGTPSTPGQLQRERIRVIEGGGGAEGGCYVVEIVAQGVATRAVVQRGTLRAVHKLEPYGHVFYPFELDPAPRAACSQVELWVEGKVFRPSEEEDDDGRIVVPFLPPAASEDGGEGGDVECVAVLSSGGKRAHLVRFARRRSQYTLRASLFVDREALVRGNRAAQVVVSSVSVSVGVPAPVSLLRDFELVVAQTDSQGVRSEQTLTRAAWGGGEGETWEVAIKVVPLLAHVRCELRAKTANNSKVIACPDVLSVDVNTSRDPFAVFLRPAGATGAGYELVALGRNGEPMGDLPLQVHFQHESATNRVPWSCSTDAHSGSVDLGDLSQVTSVHVAYSVAPSSGKRESTFPVPKPRLVASSSEGGVVTCSESDAVQYCLRLATPRRALTGREFALVEARSRKHLFASHLSLHRDGTHVYVANLKPGDYDFHHFSADSSAAVTVRIQVSAAVGSLSRDGVLRLPLQGNSRVFLARPVRHAVSIVSAEAVQNTVRVKVQGGSTTKRRVHAVFRSLVVHDQASLCPTDAGAPVMPFLQEQGGKWFHGDAALYVSMRKLDEETVYCLDRIAGHNKKQQQPYPAPPRQLPAPSLLMRPEDLGVTSSRVVEAQRGQAMPQAVHAASAQYQSAVPVGGFKKAHRKMSRESDLQALCYSSDAAGGFAPAPVTSPHAHLDFLGQPARCVLNLVPDAATGVVDIPLPASSEGYTWVEVVAVDGEDAAALPVRLPGASTSLRDVRHRMDAGLAVTDHVVETQTAQRVAQHGAFRVGNLATAKFAVLDTLASYCQLAQSAVADHESFKDYAALFVRWPALTAQDKQREYSQRACHELDWFLHWRDAEFFREHVRPQLMDKQQSCALAVVERFMLGELDGIASEFAGRWDKVDALNWMERALVAVSAAASQQHAGFAQAVLRQLESTRAAHADEAEAARARLFQVVLQQQQQDGEGGMASNAAAFGMGGGRMMEGRLAPMMKGRSAPMMAMMSMPASAPQVQFEQEEEEEAADEDADDGDAHVADLVAQSEAQAVQHRYHKLGPAHQWGERGYGAAAGAPVFSALNCGFWLDWAQHAIQQQGQDQGFVSPNVCLAGSATTPSEALLMLAALTGAPHAPLEEEHALEGGGGDDEAVSFRPSVDCVVFLQQVDKQQQQVGSASSSSHFLVGQTILDGDGEDGNENEPAELVRGRVYQARTVVTNVSSRAAHRVKLLVQIPEGAIALDGGGASETVTLALAPFSTQRHLSSRFYFPRSDGGDGGESGDALHAWFPAHVSRAGQLACFAAPRELMVRAEPTQVDEANWAHVSSPHATLDQLLGFLSSSSSTTKYDVRDVYWRMANSREEWDAITTCLEQRGAFCPLALAFALKYDHHERTVQLLQHKYGASVGPRFQSPYVVHAVAKNTIPEVFPLVHARAHALGSSSSIVNDAVQRAHHRLVGELMYAASTSTAERLRLAVQLVEENRLLLAKQVVDAADASSSSSVQADYLRGYLALSLEGEDVQAALEVAETHAAHYPHAQWRGKFADMAHMCRTVLGLPMSSASSASSTAAAAAAPSFEVEFAEGGGQQLIIATLHVPRGSAFLVKVFKTNVELLFSAKPFAMLTTSSSSTSQEMQYILPNYSATAVLPALVASDDGEEDELVVPLPDDVVLNQNVLVHVSSLLGGGGGLHMERTITRFTCAMKVLFMEQSGVLRCTVKGTSKRAPQAYCKVYARLNNNNNNKVVFHKDGYTDACGEFDYCALNTGDLANVLEFAVLITHDQFGSHVQRVPRPSLA